MRIAMGYLGCEAAPRCAECDIDGDGHVEQSEVYPLSYYIHRPSTLTVTKAGAGSVTVISTPTLIAFPGTRLQGLQVDQA